jgi:hypothetical protein
MIRFERELRTGFSEVFIIFEEDDLVGRIDIHYRGEDAYATLCTTENASDEQLRKLIDAADEQLVMTALPFREDFVVTVWKGMPGGVYSDPENETDTIALEDVE